MADWYTPTQVQRALETTWMKLENTVTVSLEVPYVINYFILLPIIYKQNISYF